MGRHFIPKTLKFLAILIGILVWVPHGDARDIQSFLKDNSDVGGQGKSTTVTKWALLVAGSNGYDNYRHQADVCHAYQILKNGGLKDENVIVFMYDDIAYDSYNPYPGVLQNRIKGPNVYQGVPKDYTGEHVTAENFYNVILANRSGLTGGSGKVLDTRQDDHIFIYYSDHGGYGTLAMPTGEYVLAGEFLKVLQIKHKAKSYSKMVIYIEACESGSMFEGLLPDNMNIYATTAANANESSYGCYCDNDLDTCLGDSYSVSWMEDRHEAHDLKKETLDEQYKRVKKRTADPEEFDGTSHVMLYGTKKLGTKTLSNFFGSSGKKKTSTLDENFGSKNDMPLSSISPLIPQRDVKLHLLHQKYLKAPKGSSEMTAAKKQLDDEVSHRKQVDEIMKRVIDELTGSENAYTMVLETYRPAGKPVVDDWDCFKSMLKNYETHCGKLSTYGKKYTRAMANMCNSGIRAEQLASVAQVVCGASN